MQRSFATASNISLLPLAVPVLVLNFSQKNDLIGSLGILAGLIFIVASMFAGCFLVGSDSGARSELGPRTAQRNLSAALVVAARIFTSDVITYIMVIDIIGLAVLMPLAGELGRRLSPPGSEGAQSAES